MERERGGERATERDRERKTVKLKGENKKMLKKKRPQIEKKNKREEQR